MQLKALCVSQLQGPSPTRVFVFFNVQRVNNYLGCRVLNWIPVRRVFNGTRLPLSTTALPTLTAHLSCVIILRRWPWPPASPPAAPLPSRALRGAGEGDKVGVGALVLLVR